MKTDLKHAPRVRLTAEIPASPEAEAALLGCISKRAAETIAEEMNFMGALKQKEVEASQLRIIEVVRRLESEGEIELDGGNGNEAKN